MAILIKRVGMVYERAGEVVKHGPWTPREPKAGFPASEQLDMGMNRKQLKGYRPIEDSQGQLFRDTLAEQTSH